MQEDMQGDLVKRLAELEAKIDVIYISVEKTRKYFMWTLIISVALFVLPLIGLVFAIPAFMNNYMGSLQGMM